MELLMNYYEILNLKESANRSSNKVFI